MRFTDDGNAAAPLESRNESGRMRPRIQSSSRAASSQENAMKSYEPSTPRAAIGLIAVALTALTIGLGVVLPAITDHNGNSPDLGVAAAYATTTDTSAVNAAVRYIEPVEVVVYRSREVTSIQNGAAPRRKQQS
jgi:hypothetical protein